MGHPAYNLLKMCIMKTLVLIAFPLVAGGMVSGENPTLAPLRGAKVRHRQIFFG